MRNATRKKLFNDDHSEYLILWSADTEYGTVTLLSCNGVLAVLHEFPNPEDGFEVYRQTEGNTILQCRNALGLPRHKGENA